VRHSGEIKWQGDTIYITAALAGEPVGLLEDDDGCWWVSYGPIDLGVIAHGDNRLRKPKPPACGHVDNAARCPHAHRPKNSSKKI
jgi:putative transposase